MYYPILMFRVADGWLPQTRSPAEFAPILDRFRAYAREANRDPSGIDIAARLALRTGTPEDWARTRSGWEEVGANCVGVSTNNTGCTSVDQHVALLRRFREAVPA